MMALDNAIQRRHSTTEFSTKHVLSETIRSIISESLSVPTFNARNNFKIAVIHLNEEEKTSIAYELKRYGKKNDDIISINHGNIIQSASALILLFKKSDYKFHDDDLLSLGALGENISLMATSYYLGTLWVNSVRHVEDHIKKKLKMTNSDFNLCYGIALGYRDKKYSYLRDQAPDGNFVIWN